MVYDDDWLLWVDTNVMIGLTGYDDWFHHLHPGYVEINMGFSQPLSWMAMTTLINSDGEIMAKYLTRNQLCKKKKNGVERCTNHPQKNASSNLVDIDTL